MKFIPTPIPGLTIVEVEPIADDRGHFARWYCRDAFAKAGIPHEIAQRNMSFNHRAGTLRGLHWQIAPHGESKFVSCASGKIYDVAVDMRADSPTYLQWFGMELDDREQRMLFVPEGMAHGYQALTDGAVAIYSVSTPYVPGAEAGLRYDDPAIGIKWPLPATVVSEKDKSWPHLNVKGKGR